MTARNHHPTSTSRGGRKPPDPLKGEEREEGEMPTGSRRNTKNLTAAKMPPKGTKRTAERTAKPCPIQSGAIEESQ